MKKVDELPTGPEWVCTAVKATGDHMGEDGHFMEEDLELWRKDPVEVVKQLIGNPAFKDHIAYAPEKVFTDKKGTNQIFDEMWTAEWWWNTQASGPFSYECVGQ